MTVSSNLIAILAKLRHAGGPARTVGLDDATIDRLASQFPELSEAIHAAGDAFDALRTEGLDDLIDADETTQLRLVQQDYVNFYADDCVNPYVALTARGPWVVTLKGAVLHDSGGYGMLGFGHTPEGVLAAMAKPQVMANIMTPSVSQLKLGQALRREIGHTRGACPYARFLCLNSGSESVSLAGRIADVN
ncbi:MAG: lysine 6-aminotransferase, partial [Dechloromonas sp.]